MTRVPDAAGIVEGKFDRVKGKDVLVITGRSGSRRTTSAIRRTPQLMDEFIPPDIAADGYWQNEDMELDTRRKLIIGALDPRHTDNPLGACPKNGSTANPACKSGFYVISYANPRERSSRSATSSSCPRATRRAASRTAATSGPAGRRGATTRTGSARSSTVPDERRFTRTIGNGRPIWVTDLTNPLHPDVSDQPVDVWRNDKYTDYSHDVDEDDQGIAWVSGRGGIRGYATSGRHRDPYLNR